MIINPLVITDHSDNEDPIIIKWKEIQKYEDKIAKLCSRASLSRLYNYIDIVNDSHTTIGKSLKHVTYPTPKTHKPDSYYFDNIEGKLPMNYPILLGMDRIQPKYSIHFVTLTRVVPYYSKLIQRMKIEFSKRSIKTKHKESEKFIKYHAHISPGKLCCVHLYHNHNIDKEKYYVLLIIKVFEPSRRDIECLADIVEDDFYLSEVEFTMDLYGHQRKMMFDFFKETLRVNHAREELFLDYDTTFYDGNPRKKSLALRTYEKEYNHIDRNRLGLDRTQSRFLRMEIVAPRYFLKSIRCPNLLDLLSVTPAQAFSRCKLKRINYPLIYKRCRKFNPEDPKFALSVLCMSIIIAKVFNVKAVDKYLSHYLKYTVLQDHPQQNEFLNIFKPDQTFLQKIPLSRAQKLGLKPY